MKLIILSLTALAILTGCSTSQKVVPLSVNQNIDNKTVSIVVRSDETEIRKKLNDPKYWAMQEFYEAVKKAAEETLKSDKKYFAVLNLGIDNSNGFPLNTYQEVFNYCYASADKEASFHKLKGICHGIVDGEGVSLKIAKFDEPSENFYLWNAKKVLEELK